jgi:ABC-type Zn uptake system ZnuABC Zn-binding protein ZnuA
MKQERVPAIFVQAQFPANAARAVAQATGAQLITLDPLAADWLSNIRVMGDALKAADGGTSDSTPSSQARSEQAGQN